MAKGGARARSGPAPDPGALRRERDGKDWRELPAEGRTDEAPEWPLPDLTERESELWGQLWSLPQAVVWEEQRQELAVAHYVRVACEAEKSGAPANLRTLHKQLMEDLGVSLSGMSRHHWRVAAGEAKPASRKPKPSSARGRLKVVADAG